jgi:hypothetical protein
VGDFFRCKLSSNGQKSKAGVFDGVKDGVGIQRDATVDERRSGATVKRFVDKRLTVRARFVRQGVEDKRQRVHM